MLYHKNIIAKFQIYAITFVGLEFCLYFDRASYPYTNIARKPIHWNVRINKQVTKRHNEYVFWSHICQTVTLTAATKKAPDPLIASSKEANARNIVAATAQKNSIDNQGIPLYTYGMQNRYERNKMPVKMNSIIVTALKNSEYPFQKELNCTIKKLTNVRICWINKHQFQLILTELKHFHKFPYQTRHFHQSWWSG